MNFNSPKQKKFVQIIPFTFYLIKKYSMLWLFTSTFFFFFPMQLLCQIGRYYWLKKNIYSVLNMYFFSSTRITYPSFRIILRNLFVRYFEFLNYSITKSIWFIETWLIIYTILTDKWFYLDRPIIVCILLDRRKVYKVRYCLSGI